MSYVGNASLIQRPATGSDSANGSSPSHMSGSSAQPQVVQSMNDIQQQRSRGNDKTATTSSHQKRSHNLCGAADLPAAAHSSVRIHVLQPLRQNRAHSELWRFVSVLCTADCRLQAELEAGCRRRIAFVDVRNDAQTNNSNTISLESQVYADLQCIVTGASSWEIRFEELRRFVESTGRPPKRRRSTIVESRAAGWLNAQQQRYARGKLSDSLRDRIAQVHPRIAKRAAGWKRSLSRSQPWNCICDRLEQFVKTHGRLPRSSRKDEHSLSQWFCYQIMKYRYGLLAPCQIDILSTSHHLISEEVGKWRRQDIMWNSSCVELARYIAQHRRMPASNSSDEQERRVAEWVRAQTSSPCQRSTTRQQKALLSALIPEFAANLPPPQDNSIRWKSRLEEAKEFVRTNGCLPRRSKTAERTEIASGTWLHDQLTAYKAGKLSQQQISALEGLHPSYAERLEKCRSKIAFGQKGIRARCRVSLLIGLY